MPETSFYTLQENASKTVQREIAYDILKYLKMNEVELFKLTEDLPYSQEAIFDCFSTFHPDLFSYRNSVFMGRDKFLDVDLLVKASDKGINFFFENSIYKK